MGRETEIITIPKGIHHTEHQNGGIDEISVAGLAGETAGLAAHKVIATGVHGIDIIRKTADETVNNSSTFQNDDHLFFAMAVNEVWELKLHLRHIGNTTADIKFTFSIPVGATIIFRYVGDDPAGTVDESNQMTAGNTIAVYGTNVNWLTEITAIVVNGANAGNCQLQWAQNTAAVVDTKLLINSFMEARQLV